MVFDPNMFQSKKPEDPFQWVESEGGDAYDDLGVRPQVVRVSARKKTAVVNFMDICRLLRRQPKHVLMFLSTELSLSGSIDGSNKLVFKGRLLQLKHIEQVLRSYFKEYVECRACLSPNTVLKKDDAVAALDVLQCEACHSGRSVAGLRPGLLAQAIAVKKAKLSDHTAFDPKMTTKRKRKTARRWISFYLSYLYLHFMYCVIVLGFGLEPGIQLQSLV